MRVGDRFCDVNGERMSTIQKMDENYVYATGQSIFKNNDYTASFNNRVSIVVKKLEMDSKNEMFAQAAFSPR